MFTSAGLCLALAPLYGFMSGSLPGLSPPGPLPSALPPPGLLASCLSSGLALSFCCASLTSCCSSSTSFCASFTSCCSSCTSPPQPPMTSARARRIPPTNSLKRLARLKPFLSFLVPSSDASGAVWTGLLDPNLHRGTIDYVTYPCPRAQIPVLGFCYTAFALRQACHMIRTILAAFCLHRDYIPRMSKAASTASSGEDVTATCSPSSQLSRETTGRPTFRASPISDSVPYSPPRAMTTSPEQTTARFLACPVPVAIE